MPEVEQDRLQNIIELINNPKTQNVNKNEMILHLESLANTRSKSHHVEAYRSIIAKSEIWEIWGCDHCDVKYPYYEIIAEEHAKGLREAVGMFTFVETGNWSPAKCTDYANIISEHSYLCWSCAEDYLIDNGVEPNYEREPIIEALLEPLTENSLGIYTKFMTEYMEEKERANADL
jgi:hypothetical protein